MPVAVTAPTHRPASLPHWSFRRGLHHASMAENFVLVGLTQILQLGFYYKPKLLQTRTFPCFFDRSTSPALRAASPNGEAKRILIYCYYDFAQKTCGNARLYWIFAFHNEPNCKIRV
jgi:hypothetical protein